jgi:hypothetical protein
MIRKCNHLKVATSCRHKAKGVAGVPDYARLCPEVVGSCLEDRPLVCGLHIYLRNFGCSGAVQSASSLAIALSFVVLLFRHNHINISITNPFVTIHVS